ncbi:hypothetical protein [Halovenus marina]|uniref:hypothetical protein n=1 Tax=Halovenus marina TaxID=3396621 RepID=UPI003F55B490
MTSGVVPLLDGLGLAVSTLFGVTDIVLETSPIYEPTTEELLISLVLGVLVGAGLGYHAYTTGRNPFVWGLLGFFFSILAAVVYVLYVVISSEPSEQRDQLEPRAEMGDSPEFGDRVTDPEAESVADTATRDGTATQQSTADDGNQWRQVARDVDTDAGGDGWAESAQKTGSTAPREPGSEGATAPESTGRRPAEVQREQATMVVTLTHDEGRRYTRSNVTEINREGDMIALTDADGSRSTYGNAQIESVRLSNVE